MTLAYRCKHHFYTCRISVRTQHRLSTYPLRPVTLDNASPPCLTATAGTGLVRTFSIKIYHWSFYNRVLQPNNLLHPQNAHGLAFATCLWFHTAAFSESLDSVSIPMRLIDLSNQQSVLSLVSYYPTNYLILKKLM